MLKKGGSSGSFTLSTLITITLSTTVRALSLPTFLFGIWVVRPVLLFTVSAKGY